MMEAMSDAVLLRVFVGEEDLHAGQPLFKVIVEKARAMKLAGATVLQAPLGFGPSRRSRSELNVDAGDRLPIVVEIVDTRAKIEAFLLVLHDLVESGLVTLERVQAHVIRRKS
ncbi:MAG: DUF190 domain-containing protein [Candidatus Sulfotelmatobacter sp.]